MTRLIRKRDRVAVVFLCATLALGAANASAQTSFGKMRGGAAGEAPTEVDDESAETFDIAPEEADDAQQSAQPKQPAAKGRTTIRSNSTANRSRRSTNSRAAAKRAQAEETNELANAVSEPLVDEEETTDEAKPQTRPVRKKKSTETTSETPTNSKRGPVLGKAESHKYRAGMIFAAAANGGCSDVLGTAPVPMEFYEQKVRTLEEDFPRVARVDYRDLKEGGARQLVFRMRELKAGQRVEATALFEVTRYPLLPPTEPEIYRIPKTPPKECRRYLKDGPYIESNAKAIRTLAKDAIKDVDGDWNKVAAILKFVRDNVQYKEVMIEKPMRGAMAAVKTQDGDCEDMSALFIAMCRASNIPARLVRVPGHCWAEFYLEDEENLGYWFPAQVAGTEPLGSLQDCRVILQKGDNFKLPESPKEEALYVKELFMGNVKENADDPFHQFIQETDAE